LRLDLALQFPLLVLDGGKQINRNEVNKL